jgi:hypothetical protein
MLLDEDFDLDLDLVDDSDAPADERWQRLLRQATAGSLDSLGSSLGTGTGASGGGSSGERNYGRVGQQRLTVQVLQARFASKVQPEGS